MKRVLHTKTDKNGNESIEFTPTPRQILFAIEKAKAPGEGDHEIARRAGVDPSNPIKWAQKYGTYYLTWLEEFIDIAQGGREEEVLAAVGMIHATQGNYQFWAQMAKKHGVIADEPKEMKVTINTNFTAIQTGETFEQSRRRILEAYRGVVNQGGSGMVDAPRIGLEGGNPGERNRIIEVSGGSVALENPLGQDGGLPESGEPLPAMAERRTPQGTNPLLDSRKKPTSP